MSRLSASVGNQGKNIPADVLLTQRLLNGALHFLIPYAPLPEDGVATQTLNDVLSEFQRRVMSKATPDGRMDPNGATWSKLVQVSTFHPRPAHVQSFIDMVAPAAARMQTKWRVPASVLIAQAAVESGWGRSVVGNAYFGIKGSSGTSGGVAFGTREVIQGKSINITDTFRAYKNFEEAADDYGKYLSENARYKTAFTFTKDPMRFAEEIAKAGYATDPNYAATVKSVIRTNQLTEFDQ